MKWLLVLLLGCWVTITYCAESDEFTTDVRKDRRPLGMDENALSTRKHMLALITKLAHEMWGGNRETKTKYSTGQRKDVAVKRQRGTAGIWGRREIIEPKLATEEQRRDIESTKAFIGKIAHLNTRESDQDNEAMQARLRRVSKKRVVIGNENEQQPGGKTGLWGKRGYLVPVFEIGESDEVTGLPDTYEFAILQRRKTNGQRQQIDGSWKKGKRASVYRDPTRGPNNGGKVGLWGRRSQRGDASQWGRKRTLSGQENEIQYKKIF
eukprot:gene5364-6035_t